MVNLVTMIQGGFENAILTLLDYLSLHVLLCLIPAFFIAGAMAYFIPKDMIIRYMGNDSDPRIAYPMATAAGFLLAVCSCTVLPLFVGIWKKGAGLGPAITFLFVAPAINILALTYTGTLIGLDIAIARGIMAIIFAILIGIIMANLFESETSQKNNSIKSKDSEISNKTEKTTLKITIDWTMCILIIILGLCMILLAILDTNIINFIREEVVSGIPVISSILQTPPLLQTIIFFVGLFILILITRIIPNNEFVLFLWLIYVLMTGTSQIAYFSESFVLLGFQVNADIMNMLSKIILTSIVVIGLLIFLNRRIEFDDIHAWLIETWFFVKSIFPLIIIGVAIAGFVKFFIPHDLIAALVGQNTIMANLIAVLFGVFMYFPTLMEVPIAKIFLELGMAKGPLLAYLLADPELSIQSILVTRRFLGDKKNTVFVSLVIIFSVLAGLIFGIFIDQGISIW